MALRSEGRDIPVGTGIACLLGCMLACALACGCGDDPTVALHRNGADAGRRDLAGAGGGSSASGSGSKASSWRPPKLDLPDPRSDDAYLLSQTGLYSDVGRLTLAPDLIEYEPSFPQWNDDASARRWLRLPRGERVDTSDMDRWQFPVGTVVFQELSLHGKPLETRVLARTGADAYWLGAFAWNDDGKDATFVPAGASNVRSTAHDVLAAKDCVACHDGEPGKVLGFSALQVPNAEAKLLSDPPLRTLVPPGDEVALAALGYLHANCSSCHNEQGPAFAETDLDVRLRAEDMAVRDTAAYRTLVGVAMQAPDDGSVRVMPGNPEASGVIARMKERDTKTQMPPMSELTDDDGVAALSTWINRL